MSAKIKIKLCKNNTKSKRKTAEKVATKKLQKNGKYDALPPIRLTMKTKKNIMRVGIILFIYNIRYDKNTCNYK